LKFYEETISPLVRNTLLEEIDGPSRFIAAIGCMQVAGGLVLSLKETVLVVVGGETKSA
jgi:hypothetical protein